MTTPTVKGMILAAGLGTRLKPFTETHPKALYPVSGKPLLRHAIEHLASAGITEIIINVHHFAEQILEYLYLNNNFGLDLTVSDETGALLETGGGLKKASWFFRDTGSAIIRNVDILSDLDLVRMTRYHADHHALVTLAVRERSTSRYFLFDRTLRLSGWCNLKTGERIETRPSDSYRLLAYSGIQVIDPALFPLITEEGRFSVVDLYVRLSRNHFVAGFMDDGKTWEDVGKFKPA